MAIESVEERLRLLLVGELSDRDAQGLLEPVGFTDWKAAAARLRALLAPLAATAAPVQIVAHLLAAFGSSASPDRALVNLQRWAESLPCADDFYHFAVDRRALDLLVTLFAGSQFLTGILLRTPAYSSLVTDRASLSQQKSLADFCAEAERCVASDLPGDETATDMAPVLELLRFQQREQLRIGLGDLGGLLNLSSVTSQVSYLAESIVRACLARAARRLHISLDGFAVLAMGKLGGGELNYSSDIDLIFLGGAQSIHYQRLGQMLINTLTATTGLGFLYRVDMRLRPWGTVGPLICTTRGYLAYLQKAARLWEKQALLRARVIAGSDALGDDFLASAAPYLFAAAPETIRSDVHAMKQRTEAWLRQSGHDWGEVKLGEGSIRDVEFVVQYLQMAHGAEHPELRSGHTLEALRCLAEGGFLPQDDYRVLTDGYIFLRTLEHYLQILDYQQTHTLPTNPAERRYLAHRLGFTGSANSAMLITRYMQHSAAVRAVYSRHLAPLSGPERLAAPASHLLDDETGDRLMAPSATNPSQPAPDTLESSVQRHLARMSPSYVSSFSADEIRRHVNLAASLSNDNPAEVCADALEHRRWKVTIVAFDYLGELSIICGLLFAYGFSIVEGQVHTYEPQTTSAQPAAAGQPPDPRRKIVDVFIVRLAFPDRAGDLQTIWSRYAADLAALLRLLQARRQRDAQGELAKRVAVALPQTASAVPVLHPIDIQIDNRMSEQYTVLIIDTPDTVGFLYEFANALALNNIHIAQVAVSSSHNRVHDILYVTDAQGRKLTGQNRERELRAATVLVKHFTHLLPHSPNPETALEHFHEYLGELFRRPSWPDELASLEQPAVLAALARLLGVSDFLWDDFLRMQYGNLFPVVQNVGALAQVKNKAQLLAEIESALDGSQDASARFDILNAFKDREMFRIDMRHIMGHITDFSQFSAELTDLVEAVVLQVSQTCAQELSRQFGEPRSDLGAPIPFSVCVLGKCGGYELGYASDIELMFIYSGSGNSSGPRVISASEYFEKLVVEFMRAIRARHEGIFEIDLDFRPYGKSGSLSVSLDSFRRYFVPGGPAWAYERQALLKLRAIAGDPALGAQVESLRDSYVYSGAPFDVPAMQAMRERQLRHLVTPGAFNAKYSRGGLVDVEYVVQGLQIMHGRAHPELRLTNTRAAIAALVASGILPAESGALLKDAHLFLQSLINALRIVRGNSRDLTIPPQNSEEFAFLARRLGYINEPARLQADLLRHSTWLQRFSSNLLQQMTAQEQV